MKRMGRLLGSLVLALCLCGGWTTAQAAELTRGVLQVSQDWVRKGETVDVTFSLDEGLEMADGLNVVAGTLAVIGGIVYGLQKKGDLNDDSLVDYDDVALFARHMVGLDSMDTTQRLAADMDSDGRLTVTDLALLIRAVEKTVRYEVTLNSAGENRFFEKNEPLQLAFQAQVTYDAAITDVTVDGTTYPAESTGSGLYTVTMYPSDTGGQGLPCHLGDAGGRPGGGGAQQHQQRVPEEQAQGGEQHAAAQCPVEAEGRTGAHIVVGFAAQVAAHGAGHAHPEQVVHGIEGQRHRVDQRDSGVLHRVAEHADKEGVGQVVQDGHQRTDDDGGGQLQHGAGHRHALKQVFLALALFHLDRGSHFPGGSDERSHAFSFQYTIASPFCHLAGRRQKKLPARS